MNGLTFRELPQAQDPALRYQVGRVETRPLRIPRYQHGKRSAYLGSFDDSELRVSVFHLLGWGSSPLRAERMAHSL